VVLLLALALAATPNLPRLRRDRFVAPLILAALAAVLPIALGSWLGSREATRARQAPPEERRHALERACRLDPRSGAIAFDLGFAELERGEAAAALAHLARSRRLLANVGTDVAIGNAELTRGDAAAAVRAYRAALGRHPALFRAHANLAEALRQTGDLDGATRHLALAREIMPHHPKLESIAERLRKARIDRDTEGPAESSEESLPAPLVDE
jgi:tetratricopeptide (TPR) repeat protein